jgi:hypothetical protein
MVGVPQRGKGCEACRKRRISVSCTFSCVDNEQLTSNQCDHGRPKCLGCKSKGRDCRYPAAFTFVVNDPGSHTTCYRKPRLDRQAVPETVYEAHKDTPKAAAVAEHSSEVIPPCTTRDVCIVLREALPILRQVSNMSAMQQQLLSYAVSHFSAKTPADIDLLQTWIPTLQGFATSSTPLKASPLACCAAWIARRDHSSSMVDFSRHLYAEGLSEVRTALRVPGATLDDEALGACLSLAAFEVFECPARCRSAYQWHRLASVNLVRMRGAKMHRIGLGHELFLAIRLHGVCIVSLIC